MLALPLVALLAAAAPSPRTLLTSGPVRLLEVAATKPVPLASKGAAAVVLVEGTAQVPFYPENHLLEQGAAIFVPSPGKWWLTPQPRVRALILALPTPPNVAAAVVRNEKDLTHYRMLGGQGEVVLVL